LAQAVRRTKPTAPSSKRSGFLDPATSSSCSRPRPIEARVAITFRMIPIEPCRERIEGCLSLDQGEALLQPDDHVEIMRAPFVLAELLRTESERQPEVGFSERRAEPFRHDPDDAVPLAIESFGQPAAKPPGSERL
jgi:hypothetical protein